MKRMINLICVLGICMTYAQQQDSAINGAPTNVLGLKGVDEATMLANVLDQSKISGVFYQFDDIRFGRVPTDGSFLLFETWANKGELVIGQERLVVANINYHVDEEKFISELDNDSTFVYDFKGIDRIIVNSRPFINLYSSAEGKNKVYEVIEEGPKMTLVKNYYSTVSTGSANPMLNRTRNKIHLKNKFFVLKNGGLLPFTSNKSGMKRITSGSNATMVDKFVKENKLSYRKESDLKQIFAYLNTL